MTWKLKDWIDKKVFLNKPKSILFINVELRGIIDDLK
jgi:hypothetical protein